MGEWVDEEEENREKEKGEGRREKVWMCVNV